jgi:hypothetical protein
MRKNSTAKRIAAGNDGQYGQPRFSCSTLQSISWHFKSTMLTGRLPAAFDAVNYDLDGGEIKFETRKTDEKMALERGIRPRYIEVLLEQRRSMPK